MRMTKINVLQMLASSLGASHPNLAGVNVDLTLGKEKGQKRSARPKPSGAAAKRLATKRNNIRKRKQAITMNEETLEIIEQLIEWHQGQVDQLQMVIDKADADIKMEDLTIKSGTPLHNGIVIGIRIALMQLGELPISLSKKN